MLARLIPETGEAEEALCPGIESFNVYKTVDGGPSMPLTERPDYRVINSEVPLSLSGAFYADGDPCREAIIMTISRDAFIGGTEYLRTFFDLMRSNRIIANLQIANVLLLANGGDPETEALLEVCRQPFSDIAITDAVMSPAIPRAGDTVSFSLEVSNLGTLEFSDVAVSVDFESVNGGYLVPPPVGTMPRVTLAPGETVTVLFDYWELGPEHANEDVRFIPYADRLFVLDEPDESNNRWNLGVVHIEPAAAGILDVAEAQTEPVVGRP
jgi:hypothetical protein